MSLLLLGILFPEEVEVTFSAPENRANLDATILEKDSLIEEIGQSSDRPERVCSYFVAWTKEEKVIRQPLLHAEKYFTYDNKLGPRLKSALRPPPSARAESANFRTFYVKRADFSPPPPATKKRRKLVQIRPRCPHLATTKRRKVVKIRPYGGWSSPLFLFKSNTVK